MSRSDVFWTLAHFVLLQAGLALAVACWLPGLRDPAHAYKADRLARRSAAAPAGAARIIMLGSSRTVYGLDGRRLEETCRRELGREAVVFNFGIHGGGALTALLTLERLLAEGLRPDCVLVEVVPPFLAGQPGAPTETQHISATRLLPGELDLVERFGLPGDELRRAWRRSFLVPWYAHRFNILSRVVPAWLPLHLRQDWARGADEAGWVTLGAGRFAPSLRRHAIARTLQQFAPYFEGFTLGGPTCQALRELLERCRAEGIAAALVLMPEASAFRALYSPAIGRQVRAFLDGLSEEFGVEVIDAREWVEDAGFSDGHHLLAAGSARFSNRLGREVLLPLLRAQSAAGSSSRAGAWSRRIRALVKAAPTAPSTTRWSKESDR